MTDLTNRQWHFASNPAGAVTPDTFSWGTAPAPQIGPGEVLVRNRLLSLDPANRAWMRGRTYREQIVPGDVMHGFTLSEVIRSTVPDFAAGDIVEGMGGWQDYAALPAADLVKRDKSQPLEHLSGIYGVTGLTAYFGLFEVGRVKAGDTVLVSAAAGAVGSVVGQLARVAGARAVGIAGSPEKCAWLEQELGFDATIDYRAGDVAKAIRAACPEGVDVYFDNVGGVILDGALRTMNVGGVVVCSGAIASYDVEGASFVSPLLPGILVGKRLRMEGFIVLDRFARRGPAERRLTQWVREGRVKAITDTVDGLEYAPEGLIRLLAGGNRGKMVVRIA